MTPFTVAQPNGGAMGVRGRKRRLGTKARDALELLAAASPSCPEPLLLAHGIKRETLDGLVRDRFATIQRPETTGRGDRTSKVIGIAITDAGRKAIAR